MNTTDQYKNANATHKQARVALKSIKNILMCDTPDPVTDGVLQEVIDLTKQSLLQLEQIQTQRNLNKAALGAESTVAGYLGGIKVNFVALANALENHQNMIRPLFLQTSPLYDLVEAICNTYLGSSSIANKRYPGVEKAFPMISTDNPHQLQNSKSGVYRTREGVWVIVICLATVKLILELETLNTNISAENAIVVVNDPRPSLEGLPVCNDSFIPAALVELGEMVEKFIAKE